MIMNVQFSFGHVIHTGAVEAGVKMTPKTAFLAAIFGIYFSGTHILVVKKNIIKIFKNSSQNLIYDHFYENEFEICAAFKIKKYI